MKTMTEVLDYLFDYYYTKLNLLVDVYEVMEKKDETFVRKTTKRVSQVREMIDDKKTYDDTEANNFNETESEKIAGKIFDMTISIIIASGKEKEAYNWSSKDSIKSHKIKVNWSEINLIKLEIRDPYNKMYLSRLEKDGVCYGYKRKSDIEKDYNKEEGNKILDNSEKIE